MYVGFEVHDECVVELFCEYFGVSKGVVCAICMRAFDFLYSSYINGETYAHQRS